MSFDIQSTVSCWHTHVVVQQGEEGRHHYLGKLNTYNNIVTQTFAKLFGVAKDVLIGHKIRTVHKKSYVNFLKQIGVKEISCSEAALLDPTKKDENSCRCRCHKINSKVQEDLTIKATVRTYKNFLDALLVAEENKLSTNRAATPWLSKKKQEQLFQKLIKAISGVHPNSEKAKKMIAKGAPLDKVYYDRGKEYGISYKLSKGLPDKSESLANIIEGAPLIHAQEKKMESVVRALKDQGACQEKDGQPLHGSKFTLKREIIDFSRKTTWGFKLPKITFNVLKFVPTLKFGFGFKKELFANIRETREDEKTIELNT